MKILDLTHTITEDMPVYPGTLPPRLESANTYEENGFRETLITMYSHTGTHMDAPAHLFPGRTTLDQFPVSQFAGKALVVDCLGLPDGGAIGMERLAPYGDKARQADFLLFHLGWDERWGTGDYFGDYPCIDDEVLQFVLDTGKKGIGFDVIGVDPIPDEALTRHKKLFRDHEIVNIENLKNLGQCGGDLFWFFALPLKQADADGAPVRAVAFWPDAD
ncbi:MAG: cyclase family protein [Clostridiales bacterium]|nr:cyclase family protein [Clostridiales bacterium]